MEMPLILALEAAAAPEPMVGAGTGVALAIALLVAAIVCLFLEIMLPSFGLLTVAGIGCMLGSVFFAFAASGGVGWTFVVLNGVSIPASVVLAFKVLPHTPLVVKAEISPTVRKPASAEGSAGEDLSELAGAEGVALTRLGPGGTARIDGKKYDVVSSGEWIGPDTPVIVTAVEGRRIEVKAREV